MRKDPELYGVELLMTISLISNPVRQRERERERECEKEKEGEDRDPFIIKRLSYIK